MLLMYLSVHLCHKRRIWMSAMATMADAVARALTVNMKSSQQPLGRVQVSGCYQLAFHNMEGLSLGGCA